MKPIYKFILHCVNNLFPLNEYSEGEIKRLMNKFQEEADDLNISINDNQLKKYIKRFDSLKNSPKITEKDLRKYSLSKLIKLVTASKGSGDEEDEEEDTPDIVYNEDGLIIYNGSKENNCLTYGAGERWCITRGSFGNYRYDSNRKNPTFYLVKDTNLPNSDPKSFFVVVVGSDNTYKVSDRTNNDVGGHGTEWDRWENWNFVGRHFPSVANIHHIFKYIPLSAKEKFSKSNNPISFREWLKLPFNIKEQYLVMKKGNFQFFSDINNEEFIIKYIPKLPSIANILAKNNDIAGTITLLKTIDYFSKQDQNSIISNIRNSVDLNYLESESIPFEAKKALVKTNKWDLENNKIYVTKDGSSIVLIRLGEDLSIGVYTEDDDYPNIKLNNRTIKYVLDYPELDTIPFKYMIDFIEMGIVDKENINKIIKKIKEEPNSNIIIKKINDEEEILIDNNSLSSYVIKNDKIEKLAFEDENVQKILDSTEFKNDIISKIKNILSRQDDIPITINKESLINLLKSLPYSERIINNKVILTSSNGIFLMPATSIFDLLKTNSFWQLPSGEFIDRATGLNEEQLENYWEYLRSINRTISDDKLKDTLILSTWNINRTNKIYLFTTNPPLGENNNLIPKIHDGNYLLINKGNPSQSFKLSGTGKLVKANISTRLASQILGTNITGTGTRGRGRPPRGQGARIGVPMGIDQRLRRRGRPPRGQERVRQGQERVPELTPQQGETIDIDDLFTEQGLINGFRDLPRRFRTNVRGVIHSVRGNRGAARRQNMLGVNGAVESVVEFGRSSVYIIRLYPETRDRVIKIASVVIQPGNSHYIVTENGAFGINSPSELVSALRNRNLLEIRHFITREYIEHNPNHLEEVKNLLKQYIQETKIS